MDAKQINNLLNAAEYCNNNEYTCKACPAKFGCEWAPVAKASRNALIIRNYYETKLKALEAEKLESRKAAIQEVRSEFDELLKSFPGYYGDVWRERFHGVLDSMEPDKGDKSE